MSYLRLLKLLYIADRESLQETGSPILGGRAVAMDLGPLHSEAYNLVKGEHYNESLWSRFIEKDGYVVNLKQDPGVMSLSRYEIGKLNDVSARHAQDDDWFIVDLTHHFEEYKHNYEPMTSKTIPWEDIIDAVGRSADRERIMEEAACEAVFDRVFGSRP